MPGMSPVGANAFSGCLIALFLLHGIISSVKGQRQSIMERIAVTENGVTYFDAEDFARVQTRVEEAGGGWSEDMPGSAEE